MALFNGHGKNHKTAPFENGYVGYDMSSRNGFHEQEANETSPEKTVGHGRPISQSFPKRLPSWRSPVCENNDRVNHGRTQYSVVGDKEQYIMDLNWRDFLSLDSVAISV